MSKVYGEMNKNLTPNLKMLFLWDQELKYDVLSEKDVSIGAFTKTKQESIIS